MIEKGRRGQRNKCINVPIKMYRTRKERGEKWERELRSYHMIRNEARERGGAK